VAAEHFLEVFYETVYVQVEEVVISVFFYSYSSLEVEAVSFFLSTRLEIEHLEFSQFLVRLSHYSL